MTGTVPLTLITGASRGFGAALAEALAAKGHHILALARTTGALEALDDRIQNGGGSATLIPIDITETDAMAGICRSIFDRWGKLENVIHCAVQPPPRSPVALADPKTLDKAVATNITATAHLIRMTAPLLGETGRFVGITDPATRGAFWGYYAATKAAQAELIDAFAAESAKIGPRVDQFAPKPMPTATRARFFPGEDTSPLTPCTAEAARLIADLGL